MLQKIVPHFVVLFGNICLYFTLHFSQCLCVYIYINIYMYMYIHRYIGICFKVIVSHLTSLIFFTCFFFFFFFAIFSLSSFSFSFSFFLFCNYLQLVLLHSHSHSHLFNFNLIFKFTLLCSKWLHSFHVYFLFHCCCC